MRVRGAFYPSSGRAAAAERNEKFPVRASKQFIKADKPGDGRRRPRRRRQGEGNKSKSNRLASPRLTGKRTMENARSAPTTWRYFHRWTDGGRHVNNFRSKEK